MVVFGGICGRSQEPLASSLLLTLSGDLPKGRLEAKCEPLEMEVRPLARFSHAGLWLKDLSAMTVFGGRCHPEGVGNNVLGDLWMLERVAKFTEMSEWRWREVVPADRDSAAVPAARCYFASCELSGRSFFVHGGHTGQATGGLLNDAWLCWIDDGFDELDCFDDFDEDPCTSLPGVSASSRPSSLALAGLACSPPLSRQQSEQLTRQVSDSFKRLAPQVSVSSSGSCHACASETMLAGGDGPVAIWRRVEADGPSPHRCCGHAAVCCRDNIIIYGVWSGTERWHQLGPLHVLHGLIDPTYTASLRGAASAGGPRPMRPHYAKVDLPGLGIARPPSTLAKPLATLVTVGGRPVPIGGWGSRGDDAPKGEGGDDAERAWHASCRLPADEACGPLVAIFGGRDFLGNTRGDLLLLHWGAAE